MNQPQVSPAIPAAAALGGQLPTSNYWSQQHFEDELEYVFRRSWINICRADEVTKPGDFIVQDLYAIGTSVIVVRGNDGVIRAFHNMCTHRGNQVEVDLQGNKKWFTCLFHGWTYDHEGHLVGLPQSNKFSTVQKDKSGLTPIHVGIWGGFVHICLAEKPPHDDRRVYAAVDQTIGCALWRSAMASEPPAKRGSQLQLEIALRCRDRVLSFQCAAPKIHWRWHVIEGLSREAVP